MVPPGRNADRALHGKNHSKATDASATDPEARRHRAGCAFPGHARVEASCVLALTACDLVELPRLLAAASP